MRWKSGRRSRNIEDRRGIRISRKKVASGGIGIFIIALMALFLDIDPRLLIDQVENSMPRSTPYMTPNPLNPEEEELADFVSVVLADTEDTWHELFSQMGKTYQEPTLVLFSGAVESACGYATAAVGPFYCPPDQTV